jgi:L-rhamnose mutarotase
LWLCTLNSGSIIFFTIYFLKNKKTVYKRQSFLSYFILEEQNLTFTRMSTQKFCLALDLKDDQKLIEEYKELHKNVWPEIIKSIKYSGITVLDIYCTGNRLFMIIEADADFTLDKKSKMDASNEKVQEWETLMWKFQQALPWAKPGEKWVLMEKIFEL